MIRILIVCVALLSVTAQAHFHSESAAFQQWAESLHNRMGLNCCTKAEGAQIKDPDWGIAAGRYWVFIHGERRTVPPDAVIESANPTNTALAWLVWVNGVPIIKCFLPGHLS